MKDTYILRAVGALILIAALIFILNNRETAVAEQIAVVEKTPEQLQADAMLTQFNLGLEQQRADALVGALPVEEVLGSLAPIALSPFFALTCLSGVSLLGSTGILPDGIANNYIMGADSPLNNEAVFFGMLILTLLTAAPKLTKVSKPFAEAVDIVEAYSGIVAAVAVQFLYGLNLEPTVEPTQVAIIYEAGFFSGVINTGWTTLLMVFSVINIFVINTVKFFFEVMIMISPFPTVDAIFEAANKGFAAFLVGLYVFSPWAATFLNILMFLISLVIFTWAYRRVVFMRSVLGDPLFGWLAESLFFQKPVTITSKRLASSLEDELPNPTLVIKAFATRRSKGIKRKSKGYLVKSEGNTYFVRYRFLQKPIVKQLAMEGIRPEIGGGLLAHHVHFVNSVGDDAEKFYITKRYNRILTDIQRELGNNATLKVVEDDGNIPGINRSFGKNLKSASKEDLQAEFA